MVNYSFYNNPALLSNNLPLLVNNRALLKKFVLYFVDIPLLLNFAIVSPHEVHAQAVQLRETCILSVTDAFEENENNKTDSRRLL